MIVIGLITIGFILVLSTDNAFIGWAFLAFLLVAVALCLSIDKFKIKGSKHHSTITNDCRTMLPRDYRSVDADINRCQFWSCDTIVNNGHFLCHEHHTEYKTGQTDKCPNCGQYKRKIYDLCLICRGEKYTQVNNVDEIDFRKKYPANYMAKDGHYVRSKAELIIDNSLYDYRVIHAYERKPPIDENLISDFYLPDANFYIEFWGISNNPIYATRKSNKLEIYNRHHLNLIELTDKEIENLDDYLPKQLLKYGIRTAEQTT
ncbi:hypothetical protein ACFLX3_03055 [Chloroflexota bacterium]